MSQYISGHDDNYNLPDREHGDEWYQFTFALLHQFRSGGMVLVPINRQGGQFLDSPQSIHDLETVPGTPVPYGPHLPEEGRRPDVERSRSPRADPGQQRYANPNSNPHPNLNPNPNPNLNPNSNPNPNPGQQRYGNSPSVIRTLFEQEQSQINSDIEYEINVTTLNDNIAMQEELGSMVPSYDDFMQRASDV